MLVVKNPLASAGDTRDAGSIPGLGRTAEGGHGIPLQHSCLRIPWTEKPGGLQSTGLQRVGNDSACAQTKSKLVVSIKSLGLQLGRKKSHKDRTSKEFIRGKKNIVRVAGHTGGLRESHPHGGSLSHVYAARVPGFLWPIVRLCLALSPCLVHLRILPCVPARLSAKTDSTKEAYGQVDSASLPF